MAGILFIAGLFTSCGAAREMNEFLENPGISTPNFSSIPDGTYRGEHKAGPFRSIVEVEMKGGKMASCEIVKSGREEEAEQLIELIVERQSLDVDAITGATYTSAIIRKAIQKALTENL